MQTILVIDDEEAVRGVIATGLKRNRFKVLQARNGREGIDLARKEPVDLILCDLHLGEADTTSTLDLLKKNAATANIPFLLMTGAPNAANEGEELLVKPFTLPGLVQAVQKQLRLPDRKRGGAERGESPGGRAVSTGGPELRKKTSVEQLQALLARVQALREEERTRLARAIHDDLTQTLTVVAIELSLMESSLNAATEPVTPADYVGNVRKLVGLVNELIGSAQGIMAQLRPKLLDEFGFLAALEWLTERVQQKTGMECELVVEGTEGPLEQAKAGEIYRFCEEVLLGAASGAAGVSIRALNEESGLTIEMITKRKRKADGGDHLSSLELLALRERAQQLRGSLDVQESPGGGMAIRVEVPYKS